MAPADSNHDRHLGRRQGELSGEQFEWPNTEYVPPAPKLTKAQRQDRAKQADRQMLEMKRDVIPREQSGIERSTTSSTTLDRVDGIEQAHGAVEDEFKVEARQAAIDLSSQERRWTVDELWDLLDGRGHFTEHPKGMTGLLRRFAADGIIRAVGADDPDRLRPSRRTNASRHVQVYESLIYQEPPPEKIENRPV